MPTAPAEVPPQLEALYLAWMRSQRARNLSPATLRTYGEGTRQFLTYLASEAPDVQDVAGIRRSDIETWLTHLTATRSASTAKTRHTALSRFLKWCVEEEELGRSPMERVPPPMVPEKAVPVLSDDELRALLAVTAGKTFADRRDHAIIRLFADTGMRRSELSGLRVSDLDLDESVAFVLGKGRRPRACPYGNKTGVAIDRYLRVRRRHPRAGEDAMWLGDLNKGPVTHDGVEQMLRRRGAQAGVEGLHAHRFRHTAAHTWLASGNQEQDLMRLLGWRSRAMLGRYGASAADERAREAYRRAALGDRL